MLAEQECFKNLPPILTVDELAEILRIGRVKAYEIAKKPGFPSIKIGRAVRIPTQALFIWLNKNTAK